MCGQSVNGWAILQALWFFLPAYVANMSPVFSAKLIPWWGRPIDGGRMHSDGERLLGDGKTWRGLIGGGLAGGFTAFAMTFIAPAFHEPGWLSGWDFGAGGYPGGPIGSDPSVCVDGVCTTPDAAAATWYAVFLFGFIVGFAALAGDAIESFLKRRTGRKRGAPWIPFDQLDFVVFGLLGALAASPLLVDGWVVEAMFGDWIILTTLLVGTPLLHLTVNRVGYWLKLKEVPW